MHRRLLSIALIVSLFTSCKKENDSPQWDIDIIGPLAYARLGIGEIIGDSSITTLGNNAVILDFDTTISQFEIDSIYEIADTTLATYSFFPSINATLPPGASFNVPNSEIKLGAGNVLLKSALVYSGKIRLDIKNTIKSKLYFTYTIPGAIKNGQPFTINATVDSGSYSDPKYFSGEYAFDGYSINLTGQNGNKFNTIYYVVQANAEPAPLGFPFPVLANDTIINLETTLIDIQPSYVKGYLGQEQTQGVTTQNSGIGGLIKSGTVELDSISMNIDVINYIGADAQVFVDYFSSTNNRTGTTIDLIAPSFIQQNMNINRAVIIPQQADSLLPTHFNILLDHNNSNIRDLIENLPDKFEFDTRMNLNPLGNVSGSNDFVYRDRLLDTRLRINMPLRFALNQLILADTVPFTIRNATNFDPVGSLNLTLLAVNGFPIDFNLQLFLLDTTKTVIDSMFVPDLIRAAPYDANYRATGTTRTEIVVPVDSARKERILSVDHVAVRMQFNTPDYPQMIQMYSDYHLDFKIIADGKYSIR